MTEIYKTKNDLGPKIMKNTFHYIQKPYNLRNDPELQRRRNRTVYFGTESKICFLFRSTLYACPQNMGINPQRH